MNWLEAQEKKGKNLDGANVKMEGASPPCLMCSKRMREFSNRTGATIEYTYPNNKTVTYAPGAQKSPELVPPQDDPGAKNLCDNYDKHHDYREQKKAWDEGGGKGPPPEKPNYDPPPNPSPGAVTAKNPAWQSYQSEKANAQSTDDDGIGDDPEDD